MSDLVIIEPRHGVTAQEVAHFLSVEFQQPGQSDGNPLINANIRVLEDPHFKHDRIGG